MKLKSNDKAFFEGLSISVTDQFGDLSVVHLSCWDTKEQKQIVVDDTLEPLQVILNITSKNINHLLQKNTGRFEEDLLFSGQLAGNPEAYFHDEFLAFNGDAKAQKKIEFKGAEDKSNLKALALEFIETLASAAVTQCAESVIEELYMNAAIDAPREGQKLGLSTDGKASSMFFARGDKYLQISCSDPYGSLKIEKFLARMNEVYEKGAGEVINMSGNGGAGLGCVILFENCCTMILGVQQKKMTKVTCLIPLGVSSRQRAQMKKSLHWFEI